MITQTQQTSYSSGSTSSLFKYMRLYRTTILQANLKCLSTLSSLQLKGSRKEKLDRALELQEEAATEIYNALDTYLKTVSRFLWDTNITQVINAYYLDQKKY
jgi:hypothetical protein